MGQHHEQVIAFLKFTRNRRIQFLKDLQSAFEEFSDRRLDDITYSKDEVAHLVGELRDIIRLDIESELVHGSRTGVLLLQQCFSQAETLNIQLMTNISELENKRLMEAVAQIEQDEVNGGEATGKKQQKLLSELMQSSLTQKMQDEINTLKQENEKLRLAVLKSSNLSQNNSSSNDVLAQMQVKIDSLEADLNGKLQASKPVQNMKKILADKNDEIRELKRRLQKYEPVSTASAANNSDTL